MVCLKDEFSAVFERRMEEKEATINQLTEELNGLRQKVRCLHCMHRNTCFKTLLMPLYEN